MSDCVDSDGLFSEKTFNDGATDIPALKSLFLNDVPVASILALRTPSGTFAYHYDVIGFCGDSTSRGADALPLMSIFQRYNSLKFATLHKLDGGSRGAFVPLVEDGAIGHSGTLGETSASGFCDAIKEIVEQIDGISYAQGGPVLFAINSGNGGADTTDLDSSDYLDDVASAYALRGSNSIVARTMCLDVGQNNYANSVSAGTTNTNLLAFLSTIDTGVKSAISGQTEDVHIIMSQACNAAAYSCGADPYVALTQLALTLSDAHFHISTPMYALEFTNGVHLTPRGERIKGAYHALAHDTVHYRAQPWRPLRPLSGKVADNVITVRFDVLPWRKLVIDETGFNGSQTNYGISLLDAYNSPYTILNISLSSDTPNEIVITTSAVINAGWKFHTGYGGDAGGGGNEGTNIRDNAGDLMPVFDPFGVNHKLHNWCLISEITG